MERERERRLCDSLVVQRDWWITDKGTQGMPLEFGDFLLKTSTSQISWPQDDLHHNRPFRLKDVEVDSSTPKSLKAPVCSQRSISRRSSFIPKNGQNHGHVVSSFPNLRFRSVRPRIAAHLDLLCKACVSTVSTEGEITQCGFGAIKIQMKAGLVYSDSRS